MIRFGVLCTLLLVLSALSLVSSQYRARQLFIDLDRAKAAGRKLDVEWRMLQLDQTNFSKNSLIEAAAVRDLHMQRATSARTQFIALPSARGAMATTPRPVDASAGTSQGAPR